MDKRCQFIGAPNSVSRCRCPQRQIWGGWQDLADSILSFDEFPAVGFYSFAQGILFRKRRQEFVD